MYLLLHELFSLHNVQLPYRSFKLKSIFYNTLMTDQLIHYIVNYYSWKLLYESLILTNYFINIVLQKDEYPLGLFIVFVVHSDNAACLQENYDVKATNFRTKNISFIIKPTVDFNYQLINCLLVAAICISILICTTLFYHPKGFVPNETKSKVLYVECSRCLEL